MVRANTKQEMVDQLRRAADYFSQSATSVNRLADTASLFDGSDLVMLQEICQSVDEQVRAVAAIVERMHGRLIEVIIESKK